MITPWWKRERALGEGIRGRMTDSTISAERLTIPRRRDSGCDSGNERGSVVTSCARASAEFSRYRTRPRENVVPLVFGVGVIAVLWLGWLNREDSGLTPEKGVGYWLGIVGSSLMLLLLLYPLRKRVKLLRALGSVAFWFRTHMILGVVGPVLILLHANFKLGSINSNVALATMLIVALSGIVGRYFYGKIHLGLYGSKAKLQSILADAEALKGIIGTEIPVADRVVAQLNSLTRLAATPPKGVLAGLFFLPVVGRRASTVRTRLISDTRQVIAVEGKRLGWSRRLRRRQLAAVTDLVTLHVAAVKKAAALAFYERLFGLWHVFHLPLFFLLVLAAIIHIFAAHFF